MFKRPSPWNKAGRATMAVVWGAASSPLASLWRKPGAAHVAARVVTGGCVAVGVGRAGGAAQEERRIEKGSMRVGKGRGWLGAYGGEVKVRMHAHTQTLMRCSWTDK